MKLIYIAKDLSYPIGGAEISTINLIKQLRENNIEIDCIDSKNIDEFNSRLQIMGPEKTLKEYDLVLTQLGWAGEVMKIAKAASKKLLLFFHSWEHICKVGHTVIPAICNKKCKYCYYKNNEFKPDYAIANSIYTQKMLKQHFDIDSDVIYPLLNTEDIIAEERNPKYITMSRFHYMKGTDRFIEVARALPDLKFRIVGYGRDQWEGDVPDNITVSGQMQSKKYYRDTSIWLSPSRFDSFGMAIIEVQLNNIPVIATNICAVKEDETISLGSTIEDGDDVDEWVQKILYWSNKTSTLDIKYKQLQRFLSKDQALKLPKIMENIRA